jgi:hypothetical protein
LLHEVGGNGFIAASPRPSSPRRFSSKTILRELLIAAKNSHAFSKVLLLQMSDQPKVK